MSTSRFSNEAVFGIEATMAGAAASAAGEEEKLVSEDSQPQSASCADRSSLQQQEDQLSDSEGRIEAGPEMEISSEGDFRTPLMKQAVAKEPRTSLDLVVVPTSESTPDWLPAGWTMEVKVRNSGISAGSKDKPCSLCCCNSLLLLLLLMLLQLPNSCTNSPTGFSISSIPVSHHRFRSKREVFDFLETGKTARHKNKKKLGSLNAGIMSETSTPNGNDASQTKAREADVNNTPLPSSRSDKQDFSSSSKHEDASRFDYLNPPEKVKWVLTDAAEGSWTPFVDGKEVSESERKIWMAAFESFFPGARNSQS